MADLELDGSGNVYARLPGSGSAPPLVVSAHLENTVFPEETELTLRRAGETIAGPGIGDNSLGSAGLFFLVWALRSTESGKQRAAGDIWLGQAANTGEEGLATWWVCGLWWTDLVKRVQAYLALEGMALGQVYHRGWGCAATASSPRREGVTPGVDYGVPSAIHALANLVTRLAGIPLPQEPCTSLNVGIISGGTSINTIAASVLPARPALRGARHAKIPGSQG